MTFRFGRPATVVAVALVAVLAFGAAGCARTANDTRSATAGLPDVRQALMAHRWVLDPAHSSITPAPTTEVSLEFDHDTVSGTGPCNSYSGGYTLDGSQLAIGPLRSTLIGCDEATSAAEAAYLAALESDHTVDVTDRDRLILTHSGVHLEYTAHNSP